MADTPAFHDPARVGTLFHPDAQRMAAEARAAGLAPSARDATKVHLLIVDMQVDFCHEGGALHVPGAVEDIRRLIAFIYRNAERITDITCSLDSHLPHQIFHPSWWADERGEPPSPFTIVTADDVRTGRWRPVRDSDWSLSYVEKLEAQAKKQLTVWPYHVPIGGVGNALDPELWSAVFWHSIARQAQPTMWRKGTIPQTEHYSILGPEIEVPEAGGEVGETLLGLLRSADHILIAGEASSHCVLETVEDLAEAFRPEPGALSRLYVLEDCTSPVRHPTIDFPALTRKRFEAFAREGIRFVKSTEPLPF